jgi:flagellar hook assembly protein FlgD
MLGQSARAHADVLDLQGRTVTTIFEGRTLGPGSHFVSWDGRGRSGSSVAAGVYFVRVRAGEDTRVLKVVLVR